MAGIRRTWDKDFYEKRARERAEQGESFEEEDNDKKSKARKTIKVPIDFDFPEFNYHITTTPPYIPF